jgi:hypothetical protein
MATYEQTAEIHHQIEALYHIVGAGRAFIRGHRRIGKSIPIPTGAPNLLEHDRVFCALSARAATTKRAVFTVCEAGDGDSAMILARTVMEAGVLMAWMMGGDGLVRLETYALFGAALHQRLLNVIETYYRDRPELMRLARDKSDPYTHAIAQQVFGGKEDTWAYFPHPDKPGKLRKITVKEMFEELQPGGDGFAYAVPYARGSQFVHSGPLSVTSAVKHVLRLDTFAVAPVPSTEYREEALSISHVGMLLVLSALSGYTGIDLTDGITRVRAAMLAVKD